MIKGKNDDRNQTTQPFQSDNQQRITKRDLKVFGLTTAETNTLATLLENGPMAVSQLARAAGVPRKTVHYALLRLRDRGFVRKLPQTHQSVWKAKSVDALRTTIRETVDSIEQSGSGTYTYTDIVGGIEASEIGIHVFRGKRQIKRAYEQILTLAKAERVYAIQGNRSADLALTSLEKEYLFTFHEQLRRSGVIMEAVNGEHVLELFKKTDAEMLSSHLDRLVVSFLLADEYLDFDMDVIVMRNLVVFIHIRRELVVTVQYSPLVELFRNLCALLSDSGRKVDLNAYLRTLIAQKKDTNS